MSGSTQVAIIGAGPYGLSLAAHLRARGIDFRIFGTPLNSWRTQMPKGMFLKSEGFASNLYDPDGAFTLERFCADKSLGYADYNHPVPLETFCAYGLAFQQRFAPMLEDEAVVELERTGEGYRLVLDNGETLTARKVVVAVGAGHFRFVPEALKALPAEYLSHAADHHDLSRFAGRDVIVVGGGASAIDLVAVAGRGRRQCPPRRAPHRAALEHAGASPGVEALVSDVRPRRRLAEPFLRERADAVSPAAG